MIDSHPEHKSQAIMILISLACLLLIVLPNVIAQPQYYFEVGATGDNGSKGNLGVEGEIRTYIFNMSHSDEDQFYVADTFSGGSAIFFGYSISLANNGTTIYDDARWSWSARTLAGGFGDRGPAGSAGLNGTWHSYSVVYDSASHSWVFDLDGVQVDADPLNITETAQPVYFAAERISSNANDSLLGPVEFRNLSYLKEDGWHPVTSLTARVICLINDDPKTPCNLDFPYGVLEVGANHILAGSGLPKHAYGEVLWTTNPIDYLTPYLAPITIIALMIVFAYFAIRRRLIIFPTSKPTIG